MVGRDGQMGDDLFPFPFPVEDDPNNSRTRSGYSRHASGAFVYPEWDPRLNDDLSSPPWRTRVATDGCNGDPAACANPTCTVCDPLGASLRERLASDAAIQSDSMGWRSKDFAPAQTLKGFVRRRPRKSKSDSLEEAENDSSMNSWHSFFGDPFSIVDPDCLPVKQFNNLFVWTSLLSFVIDPLFLLLIHVDENSLCLQLERRLLTILVVFRTFSDGLYAFHTYLQFRLTITVPHSKRFWWGGKYRGKNIKPGDVIRDKKLITSNYLRNSFVFDLLAMLPLPQIFVFLFINTTTSYETLLRFAILLQFIPRCIVIAPILDGSIVSSGVIFESAAANSLYNLVLFLIASHLVGCAWYYLALHRTKFCIEVECSNLLSSSSNTSHLNCKSIFSCEVREETNFDSINFTAHIPDIISACLRRPFNDSSPNPFEYGIYTKALGVVSEPNFIQKYVFSFYWGFQQVCTLASNQTPSLHTGEVFFVLFLNALGMLLFASLVGNIQNFLLSFTRMSFEYQIQRRSRQKWAEQKNLSPSLCRRLKTCELHSWVANRGFCEDEAFENLTEDLRRDIKLYMSSNFVQQSNFLKSMHESVREVMFDLAKPCFFSPGTLLIKEGHPSKRMLLFLKGQIQCSITHDSLFSPVLYFLSEGDCLGEELFIHFLKNKSDSSSRRGKLVAEEGKTTNVFPLSEQTAICLTAIEAFSLEASDLKYLCMQFGKSLLRPRFLKKVINDISIVRKIRAAITIQSAWKSYIRKKREKQFNLAMEKAQKKQKAHDIAAQRFLKNLSLQGS